MNLRKTLLHMLSCIGLAGLLTASEARAMPTDALTAPQRAIIGIAAFTARGDMDKLSPALAEGLDAGLTVSEIREMLVQLYAYCGFPRSLNALSAFMEVVEERRTAGRTDAPGREASPYPVDRTSLQFGTENQTRLAGQPVQGPLYEFAPTIDSFLKAHLFGDIFQRDVLDWQTREIVTIAALAAMDGVSSQLRAHVTLGMNTGLTPDQMRGIADEIGQRVGRGQGENAASVLAGVLEGRP